MHQHTLSWVFVVEGAYRNGCVHGCFCGDAFVPTVRRAKLQVAACVFTTDRSYVNFVEATNCKGIVVNEQAVAFNDRAIPIGMEMKGLLCVRNVERRVSVPLVVRETRSRHGQAER